MEIDPGADLFAEMGLPDPATLTKEEWEQALLAYWAVDADGRVGLTRARSAAQQLLEFLAPACKRAAVVGSVRRRRQRVKDLELLVEPKVFGVPPVDIFTQQPEIPTLDQQLATAFDAGWLQPADKNGQRMKTLRILSKAGDLVDWLKVDLFVVMPPAQWGSLMMIRTGPADYSQWMVTRRSAGGICPDHMRFYGGALMQTTYTTEEVVPTPEEDDLYRAMGLAWTCPWDRVAGKNPMLQS